MLDNYQRQNGIVEKKNRLMEYGSSIRFKLYLDDFPYMKMTNLWFDTMGSQNKKYVVQTGEKPIQRCMLMATDPGDLVLDITCGSGTTANVAEQWGRRWITCDTSRVALTLAKQRLMTAIFAYYKLAHPDEGISSGFEYKTVPHITLKSIANNEPPARETLYDQPFIDNKKTRITGPFTVEAVPAPYAKSFDELEKDDSGSDTSIARTGETHRQSEWRDELLRTGVRAKGGKMIQFSRVEPLSGTKFIQAEAETKEDVPQKVLVVFGPEHAPLEQRQVENAWQEARALNPDMLLFCAFQFDDEAAKDIDELTPEIAGMQLLKAQMNADMFTDDLRKKRSSNESFWLVGQPDIKVHKQKDGNVQVEVMGFDYYNPKTGNVESGGKKNIAMWMLDADYDNRSIFPSQVFFPMAGAKEGWAKLARNLKAEIDEEKIEAFKGAISLPFKPGSAVAVKIIDDRGIESLRVIKVE
ncbi:MAG: DNA methyltransferase [archaeon]|nr:DNA methyltransferase [archaeon]